MFYQKKRYEIQLAQVQYRNLVTSTFNYQRKAGTRIEKVLTLQVAVV